MNGNSRGRGWSGKRGSFGKGNYNNGPREKKFKISRSTYVQNCTCLIVYGIVDHSRACGNM